MGWGRKRQSIRLEAIRSGSERSCDSRRYLEPDSDAGILDAVEVELVTEEHTRLSRHVHDPADGLRWVTNHSPMLRDVVYNLIADEV